MDRYAVIGNPIEHSKSPLIHAAFARQSGQDIEYGRILGNRDHVEADIQRFFHAGGCGLNVTVPFKEAAWRLADELSPRAETAGAVNTLIRLGDGRLRGDNTDGIGLVRDLTHNHGFDFKGKRVLILGAGGAVRGVLRPILEEQPASLHIANRTAAKAQQLAADVAHLGQVSGSGLDELKALRFDLIINGTAAGLGGEVPDIPADILAPQGWCYDMLYGSTETDFQRWGKRHGAAYSLDGLGMLVEQAAESFHLWRGIRPDTAPVIQALRKL